MGSCYESFYGRVMLCFVLVAALNLVSLIIIDKSFFWLVMGSTRML